MGREVCVPEPFEEVFESVPLADRLSIRLFGEFEMQRHTMSLPRTRSRTEKWLLALLLLRANREVERSWLAGMFWPESSVEQALFNLRRSLSNLRQVLGEDSYRLVSPTPRTVAFDPADAFCDVVAFDAARARNDPAALRRAIALYRGPLLPECDMAWVEPERSAREQDFLTALETLAEHTARDGNTVEATRLLRQVLSVEPLREATHRALLKSLDSTGDRAGMILAYRKLRLRLHDELRTEPSAETKALYQRLQEKVPERLPKRMAEPAATMPEVRRLPAQLTPLIGRTEERAVISALVRKARLVTLIGTAGIGKTRLAVQVAEDCAEDFCEGVYFFPLASLSEPDRIVPELLAVLDLQEWDNRPTIELVCDLLRDRRVLIILDNCEHLIAVCANLAEYLLSRCPHLRLLATSREALRIAGERTFRVPLLRVPDEEAEQGTSDNTRRTSVSLLAYPSVHLFAERAAAAADTFTLTEQNAPAVAAICRRLDGLPLALELAAARVSVLTAEEIATRLNDRFLLLTGGSRTAPSRQQTLEAALSWSHNLLSVAEQTLLRRLFVFSGDFDTEAACAVTALLDDGTTLLFGLVEKSLVSSHEKNGETRYFLLETIREYAGTHLQASGETREVRTRHREYYQTWAEAVDREFRRSDPSRWGALLEEEYANLRQAVLFCQADPTGGEAGLLLTGTLAVFWDLRGYLSEGRKLLHAALSHPQAQAHSSARAHALYGAGELAWAQGDYDTARSLYEEALTIYHEWAEVRGIIRAMGSLGDLDRDQGNYMSAQRRYDETLQLSQKCQDRHSIGSSLLSLAILAQLQEDLDTARSLFEESLMLIREVGGRCDVALALNGLGNLNRRQGDFATARAQYEESLALRREHGFKSGIASTLLSLGNLAMDQKDYSSAQTLYAESLSLHRAIGSRSGIAYSLESLGRVAYALGNSIEGRSLCLEALTHFRELGDTAGVAGTLHTLDDQSSDQKISMPI